MESCPICTEILSTTDVLSCGHRVHKECVRRHVDAMQDDLVREGYPPRKWGLCPLCRAEQSDILAKAPMWVGSIKLSIVEMEEIIVESEKCEGKLSGDNIHQSIVDQMPDADPRERLAFANSIGAVLWHQHQIPDYMKATQLDNGMFAYHIIYY